MDGPTGLPIPLLGDPESMDIIIDEMDRKRIRKLLPPIAIELMPFTPFAIIQEIWWSVIFITFTFISYFSLVHIHF